MAKKKNRNKDFDSWLESINSNTYIPQMVQNVPNNANYFADGGPTMRFEYYDDGTGMMRSRMATPTTDYNIANSPLMDYRTQGFDGTLKMDTLSRKDFDYRNMTPEQQTQFRDYNSNVRQNNRQYRKDVRDTKIADLNAKTDNGEGFLGKMNSSSGVNMGGIAGAAAETARVWSDPNSTALDKVGNLLGIANVSKLYTADTEKGDANINEMTGRLNDFKTNNIQDAWDTLGAGQALKLNKGPNQISLMSNNLEVKDFKRKNMLGLTLGAIGQGAASGGSVGGAWGAAGGAVTGLLAGLGGMFTNKRRAKKAYEEYENKLAYLNNNARMLNAQAQNEWRASNVNAINNGVGQEKINDMANFRAYGGNLFDDGGNLGDDYVYQGYTLPEVSIIEEAMPWYEKWYNKGKRALGRGWENVKNTMSTPTMTALPGQSPTFQGQFFPTMPSTVGDDLEYALSIASAPWDIEGIGQAAWVLKHPKEAAKLLKQPVDKLVDWAKRKTSKEYQSIANRANSAEDALLLTKDRLRNGGFDRLEDAYNSKAGKTKKWVDDQDGWVSDNSAINLEYGNRKVNTDKLDDIKDIYSDVDPEINWAVNVPYSKNRLYSNADPLWINHNVRNKIDELHYPNELRQQLLDLDVMEIPSSSWGRGITGENIGVASYGRTPAIFTDRPARYANNGAKSQLAAHEYAHTVYYPDELPKDIFNPKSKYLRSANGAEVNARGTQIKNYFGLKEGEELTAEHLKYAKNHMAKDLGYDNNMTEFFESIKDYKKAAKWLNEHSPVIGGATVGAGVLTNLDNEQNINAMGGYFDTFNLSPNMINMQNQSLDNQKYKYNNQIQPLGFVGNGKTSNLFDFGGAMNGMDLPTGMQSYDAGGTHEENPNGGVQVGVDQQGNPNLVEEGEFRWGDYIFSDRIEVDPDILTNYTGESSSNGKKRGKKGKHQPTYADKAKKYAEKNKELANDPIGKNTINDYMDKLSKAEEEQKARDAAQQEYNNALASPTQGNPLYGSMKYNGMGNANAGLNEGNAAMGDMDNSGLSNVNRSGNEMLHAFGGNLYEGGGPILTMGKDGLYHYKGDDGRDYTLSPNEVEIVNGEPTPVQGTSLLGMRDANGNIITVNPQTGQMSNGTVIDPSTLDVNQPGYNYTAPTSRDFGLSLTGSNPTSGYLYTGNDLPYDIHYGTKVDAITGNPYLNNGTINPKWQEQGNKMLGNKPMPNGAHRDMYRLLDNSAMTPGMNNNFNGHGESNYVPRHLETNYQGPFGSTFKETNPFNPDKPQNPHPPEKEGPNTNTGGGNSNTGNGGTPNPPNTGNGGGNNTGTRSNIDVTGNPGNLNAQYAAGNPWQSTPYQEWTRFGQMAKGLPWVASDAMGHTNWKYKIDNVPPDRMEALGRTGLALRNADHSGMFRAPDLMDVERQNNASQSFLANALRGISNVGGGNRGFVGAQSAAQNYNAQMGVGNNYAQTSAYNADQKLKADEFNKQTEQFNANANNQMEADNQKAKQFAKTYEMTGLQNANAERLHERNYKDAVDRAAAADRANNVTNMWDNGLNFMANEAKMNHEYNMFNSDATQQYYWDKNKRQFIFKDDPNNPMIRMNNILRRENMGALSANSQKLLNSYIQQYGNNVPQELLDGLVEIERQEQQRLADEKKATTDAGYRDLENEYDMLLADYARRMNTKAEDGTTPKFANYTQGDYDVFNDLRTNRPVDEKGNPISDDDYYSRLRMRANMMRNMMYGANSYYNTPVTVSAYGGKICTKKKKQHYYMDV